MSLVSLDSPKQAVPALLTCLEKSQPDAVQSAAVTTLGQFNNSEVTASLIEQWPGLKSKARETALNVLLARDERCLALLDALQLTAPEAKGRMGDPPVAGGNLPPASVNTPRQVASVDGQVAHPTKPLATDLSASQIQTLLKHKNPKVAERAKSVLAAFIPPSRESMIAKYQPALTAKGDAARGQVVFTQRCMACHKAGAQGIAVGPDLITVKTKGREGILTAILDPNKEVAPQYIAYTVNTKDGQTVAGIITNDSATSMTLKMMGGAEINIPRSNIKGSSASGASLMPEGIETGMSVQDMSDLLDFIESLK